MENVNSRKYSIRHIIIALSKCVREYKKYTILSVVFIAIEGILECTIPLVMNFMINDLNDINSASANTTIDVNKLWMNVGIYVSLLVVLTIIAFVSAIAGAKASAKAAMGFAANLRKDLFYKIQGFSFNNIDHFSKASLVSRQTTDIANVTNAFMSLIRMGVLAPVNFIYSFIASIVVGASLSWIFAITIPLLVIGLMLTILAASRIFNIAFPKFDALNKNVEENVRGIRTVKTYTREEYEKEKFNKSSKDIAKLMVKGEIYAGLFNPVSEFVFVISMVMFTTFGAFALIDGSLNVGGYSALMNYNISVLFSLMMLSMLFVMFSMSVASGGRIVEVLEEKNELYKSDSPIFEVKDGSIDFNNVWFKYSKDAEEYVLKDINIHISSGSTIGIIGGTGSSKSTFVNLISRFYDVTKGELLVGGENVREYDIKVLRDNVSMVLQKNVLFSGTLRENMLWGNDKAIDEEIINALNISQASEFVNSLPNGLDYYVEQGGTNFSGGQKQRLCIARALLKPAKILILDDSTSAVDTKTDARIRESLKNIYPDLTKIIIAQRALSVLSADQIIVLNDGEITGIGTAKELYRTNPIFQEVCKLQKVEEADIYEKE